MGEMLAVIIMYELLAEGFLNSEVGKDWVVKGSDFNNLYSYLGTYCAKDVKMYNIPDPDSLASAVKVLLLAKQP